MRRRAGRLALVIFVCGGLLWVGWTWWATRRFRSAMMAVDAEMGAGRFGMAARNLETALAWKPSSDEAAYVLGLCEQARGRYREAAAAWARVTPGSAFSQRAILDRLRLLYDAGRLAAAEKFILEAAEDPRNDRSDLLVLLVPIYSQIGRADEAERLLEARWEHLHKSGDATPEQSVKLVRVHIELTWKVPSTENLRVYFDQAGRLAPEDDRVWLGRAHLAIRTGAFDEAKKWLDACQGRRPDDVPVWRARLSWGLATRRIDVVENALKHLSAAGATRARVHRLNAWLAAYQGDLESERQELKRLIAVDPADLTALDRLAQLAEKEGQPAYAAELSRNKAEINRLSVRYEKLYERTQYVRDAEEMARLAQRLGRGFEAQAFLGIAIWAEPARADLRHELARLIERRAALAPRGNNLAEVLARERAGESAIATSPSS